MRFASARPRGPIRRWCAAMCSTLAACHRPRDVYASTPSSSASLRWTLPNYSLPERANAQLWAERTPAHFSFHVKAHALMTGQPTEVARLPKGLVDALPGAVASKTKLYAKDLPGELSDAIWAHFIGALEPLHETGRLGGILLQY